MTTARNLLPEMLHEIAVGEKARITLTAKLRIIGAVGLCDGNNGNCWCSIEIEIGCICATKKCVPAIRITPDDNRCQKGCGYPEVSCVGCIMPMEPAP
jgi:hypothetical protein